MCDILYYLVEKQMKQKLFSSHLAWEYGFSKQGVFSFQIKFHGLITDVPHLNPWEIPIPSVGGVKIFSEAAHWDLWLSSTFAWPSLLPTLQVFSKSSEVFSRSCPMIRMLTSGLNGPSSCPGGSHCVVKVFFPHCLSLCRCINGCWQI